MPADQINQHPRGTTDRPPAAGFGRSHGFPQLRIPVPQAARARSPSTASGWNAPLPNLIPIVARPHPQVRGQVATASQESSERPRAPPGSATYPPCVGPAPWAVSQCRDHVKQQPVPHDPEIRRAAAPQRERPLVLACFRGSGGWFVPPRKRAGRLRARFLRTESPRRLTTVTGCRPRSRGPPAEPPRQCPGRTGSWPPPPGRTWPGRPWSARRRWARPGCSGTSAYQYRPG